jgi:hypothetical protein
MIYKPKDLQAFDAKMAEIKKTKEDRVLDRQVREEECPGHVASRFDPKICGLCGIHIDSLRPPEEDEEL